MPEQPAYEYCDLVMKGGVTSGIVYPLTIVELAERHRFKNIGGTSASAIAAVLTAAAEYGRRNGNPDAYNTIRHLPRSLSSDNLLLRLFEPSSATAPIFEIVLAALQAKGKFGTVCLAKILPGSEINSLHTFLSRGICYDCCSCSATWDYAWVCSPAACNRIEAFSWKISLSGNSWPC